MRTRSSGQAKRRAPFAAVMLACHIAVGMAFSPICVADDPSVQTFHDEFFAAWNAADLEGLVAAFSEDTVYHPMNAATIHTRETLAQVYGQLLADYRVEMTVAAELLEAHGDRGTMMGLYRLKMTPKSGGEAVVRSGRYYMELRRGGDQAWRITRELTQPTADPVP